jgi:peptidoglycan hydrolase CwlO-like protein
MKKNEETNPTWQSESKGHSKGESKGQSTMNNDPDAKKKGVTRGAFVTGIVSLVILVVLGAVVYTLYNRERNRQLSLMESQRQSFAELLTARDSTINEWLTTFNQIEKDLATIVQKENLINVESTGSELSQDKRQRILDDIQHINTLLDQNKKKIAALNSELKKSGGTIKGLQEKITELENMVKQRESEVAELKISLTNKDFEIDQLNTRVSDLQISVAQKDEEINKQTSEMNTAYLVYGTYKDLRDRGIVSKEGGFLGLGRTESLIQDFPDSLFSQVDVTQTKTIPVNSRKARLITEHPTDSYEMVHQDEKTIAYIEIKNPDEFWKISKYAVVEIGEEK